MTTLLAPFGRWRSWSIIGGNLLPLLGIFYLGWDASTLVILYWMETAVVGLWMLVRLGFAQPEALPPPVASRGSRSELSVSGTALGMFLLVHAGIFMAVHLFFLDALAPGEWNRHMSSPVAFVRDFVIPSGMWIPLLGLFIARGVLTVQDIRANLPANHLIAGFYARIILMQVVILVGGMAAMLLGNPAILLVLIVILKTLAEVYWEVFGPSFEAAFANRTPPG